MLRHATLIVVAGVASTAAGATNLDLKQMAKANGLAEIIIAAESCGFDVDQVKLDSYFSEHDLDNPEMLTFISNTVTLEKFAGEPKSASECTIARATARKAGLLVP